MERSPTEAVTLPNQLRGQIRIEPLTKPPETIAGCGISFNKCEILLGECDEPAPEHGNWSRYVITARQTYTLLINYFLLRPNVYSF
ncbi:hypothetical protein [Spirosoma aerophilum]